MSDSEEGTFEEREQLLDAGGASRAAPSASPDPDPRPARPPWAPPPPRTHFHSLSVNLRAPDADDFARGSARVVETDRGGPLDFCAIDIDIVWAPRAAAARAAAAQAAAETAAAAGAAHDIRAADAGGAAHAVVESASPASAPASAPAAPAAAAAPPGAADAASEVRLALDDVLTIRVTRGPAPPTVGVHVRGGVFWGVLQFVNGEDVLGAFLRALARHSQRFPVADAFLPGALFCVEAAPRMRRAARALSDHGRAPAAGAAGATGGAEAEAAAAAAAAAPRLPPPEVRRTGLAVLEGFAGVTRVARELGENLALVFDERKRGAMLERRVREERARQRALDIHADIVASSQDEAHLPPRLLLDRRRGAPVARAAWDAAHDGAGRLRDPAAMRAAVFAGGVAPSARPAVWPVLLGLFAWDSTAKQRGAVIAASAARYERMRAAYTETRDAAAAAEAKALQDPAAARKSREERVGARAAQFLLSAEQIEKDVLRTDRTVELFAADGAEASRAMGEILNVYSEYDQEIRYCQGMSDFLSPILYNIGVDRPATVFWAFEGLMQRCERNFRIDQSGIHAQLGRLRRLVQSADPPLAEFFQETDPQYYTCFRWILVRLKRELPYHATARLWEVLWTQHVAGDELHVYIVVGLLTAHRTRIMALPPGEFDSLLRYINDMSGRIDVDFAIREGELWYRKLGPVAD